MSLKSQISKRWFKIEKFQSLKFKFNWKLSKMIEKSLKIFCYFKMHLKIIQKFSNHVRNVKILSEENEEILKKIFSSNIYRKITWFKMLWRFFMCYGTFLLEFYALTSFKKVLRGKRSGIFKNFQFYVKFHGNESPKFYFFSDLIYGWNPFTFFSLSSFLFTLSYNEKLVKQAKALVIPHWNPSDVTSPLWTRKFKFLFLICLKFRATFLEIFYCNTIESSLKKREFSKPSH